MSGQVDEWTSKIVDELLLLLLSCGWTINLSTRLLVNY